MKPKHSDWQPLDLVDKEAIQPLRSYNSRVASGDNRYYTLDTEEHDFYDRELDNDNADDDDNIEFLGKDPIEQKESSRHRRQNDKLKILLVFGVILLTCLVTVIIFQHFRTKSIDK
ncbi:uncharacterized protein LOC132741691, partial [Ruditapes philippinarum]|uniref:uncharacterized protein LOC132741691 n=1 Tax=Ruditapes philippinarum TaxID=129788 RepID=UPI00295B2768